MSCSQLSNLALELLPYSEVFPTVTQVMEETIISRVCLTQSLTTVASSGFPSLSNAASSSCDFNLSVVCGFSNHVFGGQSLRHEFTNGISPATANNDVTAVTFSPVFSCPSAKQEGGF